MKKVFTFLLLTFLFIININADVTMSYDKAASNSQRYVYKFNKYGKYIITDKKYIEIVNSDTAIIPFAFKNNKSTVNTDFTRGGLLNEEEFIVSKDSNGNTYLSQDVEFFLMKDGTIKAINILNNDVIDAGDKKYALRVTEFVIPGTKTKGSGTKTNPWEFVGTHKLTFYIENGKITNNNLSVDKYIVYAVESTEGQIVINFKPDSTFAYYSNNCDFEYEYDKTNKIHRIFKSNKDITSDKECTINLIATGLLVQYDLNGGTGNCENLSVTKGSKLTNICTGVSKPGYMFKGWKDVSGNTVTKDTIVNDNLKLTAQWEIKKYTLTVKPNGGVWNNQTENKTIEQEYMSTTTIDNPTKGSTYKITFDSNNTNATISKNIVEAERPFNNWKLTKDVNDVTTKLENNKFTFGTSNATIEANYRVNSNNTTLALISKTGHICKWNTKSDGSGTSYTSGYTSYSANSNITLYAICRANSYKVSLDNQGATTAGTSSVSVTYGKNISNITVPAKAYKVTLVYDSTKTEEKTVKLTFGGYYSETNGKGIQYINASGSGVKAYDKASNTTLYAKWNSASITLPTPSKTGNTFNGWYTQSSGGTKVNNTYTPTGNVTLYAHWTNVNYTLTINPNGGTWNNTTSNSTKTGTTNSTLSIANPTPKGYIVSFNTDGGNNVNNITSQRTFKNWSLSGSGSISGTTYTFGAGNATLTANYNNGSITLPSATKAGHKFKGWYSNGCKSTFIGNAGESYTPTSNVTLKACYSYYAYILDVYPNGGTWNGTTEKTRIDPLADPKPSIYGNKDYTGKIYSTIDIPNPIPPSGYTVSFNTNGGSSVSSIASTKSFDGWDNSSPGKFSGTTYKYGEGSGYIMAKYKNNSVNLPTPTKSGYTFVGWYTASSGGSKVSNPYIPEKNITLYAHWSANSYRLSFDANGCGTLGISFVTATIDKTYGDADDGDGLPSIAIKAGKNFDGWYTSSSGGNKITNSTKVTASSDNGILYAHCSHINYNINYNLANGTHESSHPTSAKYEDVINISNPSKIVTINLKRGRNASDATISSTSVSAAQTFAGWTATNLNTATARRGTSSTNVYTRWSSDEKSTHTYYKNLTAEDNATVNLTANWTQKNVTLPTITKSGYTCGWAVSSNAPTYMYESGATYVPNANGGNSLTLYGVCKNIISAPSITIKYTNTNGVTRTCTSNNTCQESDSYYAPLRLSITVTEPNGLKNMSLEYNNAYQSSYTEIVGSYEFSDWIKSGNTYTVNRDVESTGKRVLKINAQNSYGKTSSVTLKLDVIARTFAAQNNCTDTVVTIGTIESWIAGSTCKSISDSDSDKCSAWNGTDYFGIIDGNKTACVKEINWVTDNNVRVNAYVPHSAYKKLSGNAYKNNNYSSVTYDNEEYYYVTFPAWCRAKNCGGWVVNEAAQQKLCPAIKEKNEALYEEIC